MNNTDPTKNTTQKTKHINNTDPTKNTTQKTKHMNNMDPTKNTTQKTKHMNNTDGRWVSYKKQVLLTLGENLDSPCSWWGPCSYV
jgi:hypothetical protein